MNNDPFYEVVDSLANTTSPVSVTAAAGCGKTEAVVQAVKKASGKQLILTHTNAGVAALRSRFRKHGVPDSKFNVETIASWLAKYVLAYPSMSKLSNNRIYGSEWDKVYPAAIELFRYRFISDVLRASYKGIFVDEYQDCTEQQHQIVLMMSEWLPVRVLGDPLQGIFKFNKNDPKVVWQNVQEHFKPLLDLTTPHRWQKTNCALGEQLADIREKLLSNTQINLKDYPDIEWRLWFEESEKIICNEAIRWSGTIAGIHQWPNDAHRTAKELRGKYQSIEEMDCKELMETSQKIDIALAHNNYLEISKLVYEFIKKGCAISNITKQEVIAGLVEIRKGNLSGISRVIRTILGDVNMQVFRRELLNEMDRAAQEFATKKFRTFEDAAYTARYRTRVNGRNPEPRIISRTLLIKGLEFDHAIVLNADKLQNLENFYVAITRGSQSLTILSSSPIIHYVNDSQSAQPSR